MRTRHLNKLKADNMPIYKYNCKNCGLFTEFQLIKEKYDNCPKCGEEVELVIGKPGIQFKGKGFYSNS
jgi:putative FmdB family regulatory protein